MIIAAPEKLSYYADGRTGERMITQGSDIWSLGCVFSVAATYVVLGKEGVKQYRLLRRQAIQRLGLGIGDPFHNQNKVLPEVLQWHKYLREVLRRCDCYTAGVLDLIDQSMLIVPGESRISGQELPKKLEKILESVEGFGQEIPASIMEFLSQMSSSDQRTVPPLDEVPRDISQSGTESLFHEPILYSSRRSEGRTPSFKTHGTDILRLTNSNSESNLTPCVPLSSINSETPNPQSSNVKYFSGIDISANISEQGEHVGPVTSPLDLKHELNKVGKSTFGRRRSVLGKAIGGDKDPLGNHFENRDIVSLFLFLKKDFLYEYSNNGNRSFLLTMQPRW